MGLVVRNIQALEKFMDRVRRIRPDALPLIAKRQAAALGKLVTDEFRQSMDPYGKPWAPVDRSRGRDRRARARRAAAGKPVRNDKPLVDTGRLRASVVARAEGSIVRISLPVEYASYHQYGTRRIKRRQILPEADTGGLPPKWLGVMQTEANAALNEHFGKGRR
jgi:phage gpG-like protein